jgi:predicted tellurium resistance membrane protein TerC
MKHISWLNLLGGLIALVMATVYFGGLAWLIKATPLYVVMALGVALMIWDLVISTRETADKREAQAGRDLPAQR